MNDLCKLFGDRMPFKIGRVYFCNLRDVMK